LGENIVKIDLIVDLQFGSTGKGLLAGYLAEKNLYDTVINCNMPNAGHTCIDRHGQKMIHKVLPNGIVCHPQLVLIGPGSVFSIEQLRKEVEYARSIGYLDPSHTDIVIHESAVVLQPRHSEWEKSALSHISSTMQGSMAAMVEKMQRTGSRIMARDFEEELEGIRGVSVAPAQEWNLNIAQSGRKILAEGCQGFSLGINQGFWPYCTSRECTPYRMLSDMGLPFGHEVEVWGACRTYPIRVGNTTDGSSGPCYRDQVELDWTDIGVEAELTTVTQRPRRIFTFSYDQIRQSLHQCGWGTKIFLNFCNYMDPISLGRLIETFEKEVRGDLKLMGYGPATKDVVEYNG
jgi:adenylosuccinate synthase